ncbi:MAG: LptF/LptG family permease [Rivularia sp. (in: cyanobacteria)]
MLYKKLSNKNQIIAFQSVGISLSRLIIPALAIALIFTAIMFVFQELIIPPANYQAAMVLEDHLGCDEGYRLKSFSTAPSDSIAITQYIAVVCKDND